MPHFPSFFFSLKHRPPCPVVSARPAALLRKGACRERGGLPSLPGRLAVCLCLWTCLALAGCAVKPVMGPEDALAPEQHAPVLRGVLRHGDWIVTRSIRTSGNLVASLTQKPFSHAAIYDADDGSVIEATATGVHRSALDDLVRKSQRMLVIRPLWADEAGSRLAVERARKLIGKSYDFTGLVGLGTRERYYCTELCIESYRPFISREKPDNPIPRIIQPGDMYFWGTIMHDTGP